MSGVLSTSGRQAFVQLLHVDQFAWISYPPVGPPHQVLAFRKLIREPHARQAFRFLVYNASSAGQLYGLAGLYLLDDFSFRRTASWLQRCHDTVEIGFLGRAYPKAFAQMVAGIADGGLPRVLAEST